MKQAGYAYLASQEGISAFTPSVTAEVRSVRRKEMIGNTLAIPAAMLPPEGDILAHVMFALKHEGINLQILMQAMRLVPEDQMLVAYSQSPTGKYLRKACYLWESVNQRRLPVDPDLKGKKHVPLFDPDHYITAAGTRDSRWGVAFNGLGTLGYCVAVQKTDEINNLLSQGLMKKATEFTDSLPRDVLNRTLAWAYLHETRESYAIEKEAPSDSKASRFVNLLRQAHTKRHLTEDYFVELHNAVITNPFERAASYRLDQNYLTNGLRGSIGVTYVPPAPNLAEALMEELTSFVNNPPEDVDPIVLASIASFAFVFIHPFMDGNGRLSRFLFHYVLCQLGALSNGLVLPVSTVLRQSEDRYLQVLQNFSSQAREFWQVRFIDEAQYTFDFTGNEAIYRYWDATECVAFMARTAASAIEHHLKEETIYLERYDQIYRSIDEEYDIPGSELSRLVMFCMDQGGTISKNRRKQYKYMVPEGVFDALEDSYRQVVSQE